MSNATRTAPVTGASLRERALTRWIVTKPEKVAEAIVESPPRGRAQPTRLKRQ